MRFPNTFLAGKTEIAARLEMRTVPYRPPLLADRLVGPVVDIALFRGRFSTDRESDIRCKFAPNVASPD